MSGESPDRAAMDAAVDLAEAQLDGITERREALELLWRTAYAAGVRTGQRDLIRGTVTGPPYRKGGPQGYPAQPDFGDDPPSPGPVTRAMAAMRGWQWGPGPVLGLVRPDQQFRYGGTDPSGPVADRDAVLTGDRGMLKIVLADTGERVRMPVMFWAMLPAPAEGGEQP